MKAAGGKPAATPRRPAAPLEVAYLQAGALLPSGTPLPPGEPAEVTDARVYRHPVLGDRPVVRLTARTLAAADDVEMEVLGFSAPEVKSGLGLRRSRALGFPGWALVHDPPHARHALTVVREFKAQAKLARSKPGHARDGFDAIARSLARSVPHFLPSFHEEAGRAFLDAGNRTYAAGSFAKAREAERVHALKIDPELRDRAFLEFALAGAVTGKALSEYAQELSEVKDHADAYARFRDLCVRRTLGGMPPWAAMARDLKRLARLAGADQDAEEERLLEEVLDTPALLHAASEFWSAYGAALARLARRSSLIRATLLRLLPEPPADRTAFAAEWLALLERCGVLPALCDPLDRVEPEERPSGGAAAWLSRLLAYCRGYRTSAPDAVFALVRRMATRLREEGQPVSLEGRWGGIDVDVLDLLCELEVPVADPGARPWLHLAEWIKGAPGSKERPRDPIHAIRDARYRPLIEQAIGGAMATPGFDAAARELVGLGEARRAWILGRLELLREGTLPSAHEAFEALARAVTARTFADLPDAWEAVGRIDLGRVLARTLRGGLPDELGWPELEAVVAELRAGAAGGVAVYGAFPHAILQAGLRAVVVGPRGKLLEHELRIPRGGKLEHLTYAQGQLLVAFHVPGEDVKAYWSSQPDEIFETPQTAGWGNEARVELELEDGSLVRGGRALHAGDRSIAERGWICGDGQAFWSMKDGALRELDPRTGALGRKSLPRFLEDFVLEGTGLELSSCQLLPLPAPLGSRTPLGARDGLAGLRVRRLADQTLEVESVDGRRVRTSGRVPGLVCGLVQFPGREEPVLLTADHRGTSLVEASGQHLADLRRGAERPAPARGTPITLPAPFWHALTIRDEGASLALRDLSPGRARQLLDASRQDLGAGQEPARGRDALAGAVPAARHPELIAGILGIATEAARLEQRVEAQRAVWDPGRAPAEELPALDAEALGKAAAALLDREWGPADADLAAEIVAVGTFLGEVPGAQPQRDRALQAVGPGSAGGERILKAPPGKVRWDQLIGSTGALAFLASSSLAAAEERKALANFLRMWATTPFAGSTGRMRRCLLRFPADSPYAPVGHEYCGALVARGDHRWLVRAGPSYGPMKGKAPVVEAAPDGRFEVLPGCTIEAEEAIDDRPWSADHLRHFLEVLERRGPPPLSEEAILELARRTGLGRTEAALVWAGFPGIDTWEHDFLGKERRETLGLKAAEAKVARDGLKKVPRHVRRELLAAAMAGDPEAPWHPLGSGPGDEESLVARLAAVWNRRMGQRNPVDPGLALRCARELPRGVEPARFLAGLASCAAAPAWTRDGEWHLRDAGVQRVPSDGQEAFSGGVLLATVRYVLFLYEALPVGDALRAMLADAIQLSRKRLAHPGLLVDLGSEYFVEKLDARDAILDAVGRDPYPPGEDPKAGRDGGVVVACAGRWSVSLAFRPARIPPRPDASTSLAEGYPAFAAARLLLGGTFERLASRLASTPVPAGGYEANPLLSAPLLVKKVQKAEGLSEEAAVLYLQLLALRAPTARAVQDWNGWTATRYKKAAAELAAKRLVMEAKRARAGRDHFLPGGWEELKAPELPIETWKLPLYGARRTEAGLARPLGILLPLGPTHELFEQAWARVEAKDAPRYEEIK